MKISVLMSVFNAMEYLPYSLKSIYDFADEIIISDGLIEQFNKDKNILSDNGKSCDGTVEFVKEFPDPGKKIKFESGGWEWEKEKRQATVDMASGDWMMTVDSDEVYKPEHLANIRKGIKARPKVLSIWAKHLRFCGDFNHYYEWPGAILQKLSKGVKLYGYRELKIPEGKMMKVYKWPESECRNVTHSEFLERVWLPPIREVTCFHYSNVCSKDKAKRKKMIAKGLKHKLKNWDKIQFGTGVSQAKYECLRNLQEFEGTHPEVMKDHPYMRDIPKWLKK